MLYQISYKINNSFNAASKAVRDVVDILNDLGAQNIIVDTYNGNNSLFQKIFYQFKLFFEWSKIYKTVENNSIVFLQHPLKNRELGRKYYIRKLKLEKSVSFICLVHDVENLRYSDASSYFKNEFNFMLEFADQIIVHNESMKEYFIKLGINSKKLVDLDIFDYICDLNKNYNDKNDGIIIAGNLDTVKAKYLLNLKYVNNVYFKLYGINLNKECIADNVEYVGAYDPTILPSILNGKFGLVWDGTSINSCNGATGNYLRYNNPHKLSLYIASNIPVIVWNESAVAKFVKQNNIGFCVDKLQDIEKSLTKISDKQYEMMVSSVLDIGAKIRSGYYMKTAINKAINNIEKEK